MYRFFSYRELKTNLGNLDAMIEVNELALRSFIHQAEMHGEARDFVAENSKQYNIYVNVSDLSEIQSRTRLSYIVTVYQAADLFFRQFGSEHADLYQIPWLTRQDGETPLQQTVRNLACSANVAYDEITRARVALFDYYRWIRNQTVHPSSAIKDDRYDSIRAYLDEVHAMYDTLPSAPHQLTQVDFDDFVLFSRVVKDIAARLCQLAMPSVEKTEMAALAHAKRSIDRFSNVSNNVKRLRRILASELTFKFGLDTNAAEKIVSDVVAH